MRSTSAPAKLALALLGLGLNFVRYSTLRRMTCIINEYRGSYNAAVQVGSAPSFIGALGQPALAKPGPSKSFLTLPC